jgi:RNA polymerase sigma-70 factor (ECF subfamily)
MNRSSEALAGVFQREAGQVLAALIGQIGDFDLAEDALQDAIVVALEKWPAEGMPPNPGAWLMLTARRKALDRLRRQQTFAQKQTELLELVRREGEEVVMDAATDFPDDRLKLLFTCCHPALNLDARVALTLRTLGGLSTAEIAAAFFLPLPTMAQRLTRAKQKIRAAHIPYRVPPLALLPERVPTLLAVLYLIFNAGYAAPIGDQLLRPDLCGEAIRLTRVLVALLRREFGDHPEAMGLLALMLLHDSRRHTRLGAQGELCLLAEQDRTQWDQALIAEGAALVERALLMGHAGPYQVQAAIAALHAQAPHADDTDWPQIAALYGVLGGMLPSPVVELNRAVAVAMADGPLAGLALLDRAQLATTLQSYHLYHAARADLLRRSGRLPAARHAYAQALACCQNAVERAFLQRRLAEIAE